MQSTPLVVDWDTILGEMFPIKLVGGFITIDNHVGCAGCSWCLCRRHPLWQRVFQEKVHFDGPFNRAEEVLVLLQRMRSYHQARVPIRFGHNTDAFFQWSFGVNLYRLLPPDQPFIFMTRFPIAATAKELFNGQPNLLVKVSITPASSWLHPTGNHHATAVLASLASIPPENLYILIGPLTADNLEAGRAILRQLPPGSWADVKPLTRTGIPGAERIPVPSQTDLDTLRWEALERGVMVTDFFGCRMRNRLGRSFYKTDYRPATIQSVCRSCPQQETCLAPHDLKISETIRQAAAGIGLTLGLATSLGPRSTRFHCPEPASRGDETYLAELFNHQVFLSSVPEGSQGGSFGTEVGSVMERWQRTGMYPAEAMTNLAKTMLQRVEATHGTFQGTPG